MILVTGGAGYVGGQFVRSFLSSRPQSEIAVVDNLSEGHEQALPSTGVHFVNQNIGDIEAMKALFRRFSIDAVVHFAASAYVGESQTDPFKYYQNNVINSLNLFRAMEESKVRKLVFSSTCATYGNPTYLPLDEEHPQNPVNVYGTTKYILEKVLKNLNETLDWSFMALRYFNASGADESGLIGESHDPETHLIPLLLKVAAGKLDKVSIYGDDYETRDGTCIRDYIHVADLADAHLRALDLIEREKTAEAVNLGTATGATILEVLKTCEQVTGKPIKTELAPRRWGDPPSLVANSAKAKALLGWLPGRDLTKIVETAWRWETNRKY